MFSSNYSFQILIKGRFFFKFFEEAVEWAHSTGMLIAHDLAYADVTFDDYIAPSILEIDGAKDVAKHANWVYIASSFDTQDFYF